MKKDYAARIGAFATTMFITSKAFAQGAQPAETANITMKKIADNTSNLPQLMMIAAYIIGIGFAISGLLKVKESVENPGQAPIKDGFMRLLIGGGLLALGFVIDNMVGTIGGDTGQEVSVVTTKTWDGVLK